MARRPNQNVRKEPTESRDLDDRRLDDAEHFSETRNISAGDESSVVDESSNVVTGDGNVVATDDSFSQDVDDVTVVSGDGDSGSVNGDESYDLGDNDISVEGDKPGHWDWDAEMIAADDPPEISNGHLGDGSGSPIPPPSDGPPAPEGGGAIPGGTIDTDAEGGFGTGVADSRGPEATYGFGSGTGAPRPEQSPSVEADAGIDGPEASGVAGSQAGDAVEAVMVEADSIDLVDPEPDSVEEMVIEEDIDAPEMELEPLE